jgi:hypothetical protein
MRGSSASAGAPRSARAPSYLIDPGTGAVAGGTLSIIPDGLAGSSATLQKSAP